MLNNQFVPDVISEARVAISAEAYRQRLIDLLADNLDFHEENNRDTPHTIHAFPAKFPPQLPRKLILGLTHPGERVLDPMAGSGTTLLEALLVNRNAVGFDIDPIALLLSKVKTAPIASLRLAIVGQQIIKQARITIATRAATLQESLATQWNYKTREFVDYWFAHETQLELLALIREIEQLEDAESKLFFELVFSGVIITKSGGVSLAFDLAHTRPHRAKVVLSKDGEVILEEKPANISPERFKILSKVLRSPIEEFEKRLGQNLRSLSKVNLANVQSVVSYGNSQNLPLASESVDLIVTSPPYASNAIDYMRAHKFSLVWMGFSIEELGQKRQGYIGGELVNTVNFEELPDVAGRIVANLKTQDVRKGRVLQHYYSEMTRALREMYRVLKPGKAAIVVIGSSIMRNIDTETHTCLAAIGRKIGFEVPAIGIRNLDRNRRMLPAGNTLDLNSQIQQRMHEEYVLGFYKPESQSESE